MSKRLVLRMRSTIARIHLSEAFSSRKILGSHLIVVRRGHEKLGVRSALQEEAPNGVGRTVVEVEKRERSTHLVKENTRHVQRRDKIIAEAIRRSASQLNRTEFSCPYSLALFLVCVYSLTAKRRLRSASRDSSPSACTRRYMSSWGMRSSAPGRSSTHQHSHIFAIACVSNTRRRRYRKKIHFSKIFN